MGGRSSSHRQSEDSLKPSPPPFQLASEVQSSLPRLSLSDFELEKQVYACDILLQEIRTQKAVISDLSYQVRTAKEEYEAWKRDFVIETVRLSEREIEQDKQSEGPFAISAKMSDRDDTANFPIERTKSMQKRQSSAQQQPEVFEFREVLGQVKRAAGLRYSSFSRLSREPHLTAEETLSIEAQDVLRSNILTHLSQLCDLESLSSYDLDSTRLIVSTIIREKLARDRECLALRQRPPSFPDFLIYLLTQNTQQAEGIKHVAMLTKAIKTLYEQRLPEGLLFARLFQVFHPEPVSYQFAITLPKLFSRFSDSVQKRITSEEFQLELEDEAWLADLLETVYQDFSEDVETGSYLLQRLKPKDVEGEEYCRFVILHRFVLAKVPLSLLFTGKEMGIEGVAKGLKRDLALWISEKEIQDFLRLADSDGDGQISLKDVQFLFARPFPRTDPRFSITCLDYLSALEAAARDHSLRLAQTLVRVLGPKDTILTVEEALQRVRKVWPQAEIDTVLSLYIEVKRWKEDVWTLDLVRVLLRYPPEDWERSPLVQGGLLRYKEGTRAEAMLADSGNILEEQNEDD